MAVKRSRAHVYILILAVIVAAIAGYYLPERQPETSVNMSSREYIERVQQKKNERIENAARQDEDPPY